MNIKQFARRGAAALGICLALAAQSQAGDLFADAARSNSLGRDVKFTVYLPDGYKDGAGPYPVVYLLHGAGGDENEWRTKGGAVETLDGLIKRGLMRPSVVIMPTAGPASWWANGASEKAETAIMDDLLPPETSVTRRAPQFVSNGQFDPDTWKALNYPAHLEAYKAQPNRVPMWIVAGDHDFLGIAVMSANLYWRLYQIQPKQAELRVIDGDHEWLVFRDALPDALQYVDRACARG